MNLRRRDFLVTTGAAAAVGLLSGCREREEVFLDQAVGRPAVRDGWKEWVCTQCSASCGAQVRVVSAEAKKIEGRPEDPSSRGGLCALGQSALQEHYDPDRYRAPRVSGSETGWDEALQRVTELLALCEGPDDLMLVTGDPVLAVLAQRVATSLGGRAVLAVDEAVAAESAAAAAVLGSRGLPAYDLDGADLIVTFGASVLDAGRAPVHFARALADRAADALHVHVGPRMSLTAAKGDRWLAPRPGSLGVLAAAIGAALRERAETGAAERFAALAPQTSPSLAEAAETCDVALDKIEELVERLAASASAVVVAGPEGCGSDPAADVAAALALNLLVGADSSGRLRPRGGAAGVPEAWAAEGVEVVAASELAERLEQSKVAVLVDHDPLLTASSSLAARLTSLEGVVCVAAEACPSGEDATVLLPAHSTFERLQAAIAEPAGDRLLLSGPVLPARYDSRHPGDVLLALAAAGGQPVAESFDAFLAELLGPLMGEEDVAASGRALRRALGDALAVPGGDAERSPGGLPAVAAPAPVPDGPLLSSFASVKHHEGRGQNRSWLQELPDPLSTIMWQGWAQVSTSDAAEWGVDTGDWLEIERDGEVQTLPAVVLPTVRPGVVEVPRGYGVARGRFAADRGTNVLELLGEEGALGHVPVEVRRAAAPQGPVAVYGRGLRQNEHLPRGWGRHDGGGHGGEELVGLGAHNDSGAEE